jgi:hypothetical protein
MNFLQVELLYFYSVKKFSQAMLVLGFCLLMMVFQSYTIANKCPRVKALQAYVPAAERQSDDKTEHGAAITTNCPGSPVTVFAIYTINPPLNLIPDKYFLSYNEKGHQDDYSGHLYSPPRLT